MPDDQAAAIAARFPDLTLRTEPAHQKPFIHLGQERPDGAQWQVAGDALFGWTLNQHRKPNGGARMILIPWDRRPFGRPRPGLRPRRRVR